MKRSKGARGDDVREKIYLTYPPNLIKEPLIYELGRKFGLRTNIRGVRWRIVNPDIRLHRKN